MLSLLHAWLRASLHALRDVYFCAALHASSDESHDACALRDYDAQHDEPYALHDAWRSCDGLYGAYGSCVDGERDASFNARYHRPYSRFPMDQAQHQPCCHGFAYQSVSS